MGTEVLSMLVQDLAMYLYTDEGLVVLPWTYMFQSLFDVLTEIFVHIGLQMDVRKTVSMA